jgi:hypothetical protein
MVPPSVVVDRDKAIQFVDYHWNLSTNYRPASIDRNNGHPQFIMDALGRANPAPI